MSICPKNKSSKGRRDRRRANWKMSAPTLVKCSKCGALTMPHRVCKACGSYNKKEIVAVDWFQNVDLMQGFMIFIKPCFAFYILPRPLKIICIRTDNYVRIKCTASMSGILGGAGRSKRKWQDIDGWSWTESRDCTLDFLRKARLGWRGRGRPWPEQIKEAHNLWRRKGWANRWTI